MTKEITQEERLDLTDKQVREEYLKHTISAIENTLGILSTKQTIEDLKAEIEGLKKQLKDYEKTLKYYADGGHYADWNNYIYSEDTEKGIIEFDDGGEIENGKLAKETLKKWENK